MNNLEVNPSEYHTKLLFNLEDPLDEHSYLSCSRAKELDEVGAYKFRYMPKQFKTTDAMTWGTVVDTLITAPHDLYNVVVEKAYEDYRTNEAKAWRDEQIANGLAIVTPELIEEAQKAVQVLTERHKESARIIAKSKKQVLLLCKKGTPDTSGRPLPVSLKGLIDLVPDGEKYLVDLKTINDISVSGIEKAIAKFGYHIQAGLYLELWNIMNPDDQRNRFRFIFQDSNAPYEVRVVELTADEINAGKAKFGQLMNKLVYCAKNNHWPMRGEGEVVMVQRSTWSQMEDELEHVEAPI